MSKKTGKTSMPGSSKSADAEPVQLFEQALVLHQQGRFAQARTLYEQVLLVQPEHPDALHLLGTLCHQTGNNEAAAELILRALSFDPHNPFFLGNLGAIYQAMQRLDEAQECYRQAVALAPDYADAHFNLGNVLSHLGQPVDAASSYRNALALKPDYADACIGLGNALKSLGQADEAAACYRKALALNPNYAEAHFNLGCIFAEQKNPSAAAACYRNALALKADYAEAHYNLGNALFELQEHMAALASFERASACKPDYAEAYYTRGNLLFYLRRLDEAVDSFNRAIACKPDYAEAIYGRGAVLYDMGKQARALADCAHALALKPDYADARWALALFQIPAILTSEQEQAQSRLRFAEELEALDAWFDASRIERGAEVVGKQLPFYLAYQEEDNQPLMLRYGALCDRLMAHWQTREGLRCHSGTVAGKIKVGIVSKHIHSHSVWDALLKGWMLHLDRDRFELQVFYLGTTHDAQTDLARSLAAVFVRENYSLEEWAEAILSHQPAVLLYPEIGMCPMTAKLASLRLAPVQMASWGHPETTGLPTVDFYLSAAGLEPENAGTHYTEQLVKLPNLGCCYQRASVAATAPDWAQLGLNPDAPLLLCPGTPFKYAPRHDRVWVEIAQRLERCQLVFFAPPREQDMVDCFARRLARAFAQAGLAFADYVTFIPWQEKTAFYGLLQHADVYLDTIGFSGFNTAVQAMECGLPAVTREGRFMRGRLAGGILNRMGLAELVVATEEEYIALVVKLVQDKTYSAAIRARIAAARDVLFDDLEPVRALEDFLAALSG
jgi:protein O-GlcNAc transferase